MKHLLIQKLEEHLKGVSLLLTNDEGITLSIFPCPDCGSLVFELYEEENKLVSIELDDVKELNAARIVFNHVSGLPRMSKHKFVDFLIHFKQVLELQKTQLN